MPKAREPNLPQINANQGLYGELPLSLLPSAAENGQVAVWIHATQEWKFGHLVAGANVTITVDDATGDIEIESAGGGASTLAALTDVDVSTVAPSDSDVLAFDSSDSTWKPVAAGTPGAHATTHEGGGTDEIEFENLATAETDTALVPHPDGTGGIAWGADATGSGSGAYTLIDEEVLASDSATVDFASIPSTFKALVVMYDARSTRAAIDDFVSMRFNGDTGNNYDILFLQNFIGSGNAAWSEALGIGSLQWMCYLPGASATAGKSGGGTVTIPNYAGTAFHKNAFNDGYAALGEASSNLRRLYVAGGWRSAAAINQITLTSLNGANFLAGSRFTLYGVG